MPFWLRMAFFLFVLVAALGGMTFYVHRRTTQVFSLERRGRLIFATVLGLGFASGIGFRLFRGSIDPAVAQPMWVFGTTIILGVVIAVGLMLPVEAAKGLTFGGLWLARKARGSAGDVAEKATGTVSTNQLIRPQSETATDTDSKTDSESGSVSVSTVSPWSGRRDFLTQGATGSALLVGGSSSLYGAILGRHDYQIDEVVIPIPSLPATLDNYTIVQLSDIHFGTFIGEAELNAAIEHVRQARPDLVVLTGDLLDHDPAYAPYLGRLVRAVEGMARDGVVVIPGNHDYYAGVDEVLAAARGGGARVLVNEGLVIGDGGGDGKLAILGVDDVWTERNFGHGGPDLERAIAMVPEDAPRVLLCHNPVFFPEAAGKVDLQLSGHTHGGQVTLVVNPAELVLPHGYVRGAYDRDGSALYVNRGFGTAGPPARIGSPPEITRVVLTRG